ncbi:hypothetical protein JYT85_00405 [Desulfocapsa sp. AH-315-G09]|nr:hypothetical protein [Desulfocapsa sp.]MBN4065092.1 hypothetical protein [Desulfocapsa sp. AH-315-G09]
MKTTEDLFRDSINQYKTLITDASALSEIIPNLSPDEILHRCKDLKKQQHEQLLIDNFIVEIMVTSGPQILETPYIGEYQRILNEAMTAFDAVAVQAKAIRKTITHL